MTYKEKLKKFMKIKDDIIIKMYDYYDYLYDDDLEVIDKWNEENCKEVYELIKENIEEGVEGLGGYTCPYCAYYEVECEECSYGRLHGYCEVEYSDYDKLKTNHITNSHYWISNVMYRLIIMYLEGVISEKELEECIEMEIDKQDMLVVRNKTLRIGSKYTDTDELGKLLLDIILKINDKLTEYLSKYYKDLTIY